MRNLQSPLERTSRLQCGHNPADVTPGRGPRWKMHKDWKLNMENKFSDHNKFDKYAREQGKWIYDNGWSYKGEHFSAYMLERFDKVESENWLNTLSCQEMKRIPTRLSYFTEKTHNLMKCWSGPVNSQDDYQAMMAIVYNFT